MMSASPLLIFVRLLLRAGTLLLHILVHAPEDISGTELLVKVRLT